MEDHFFNGRDVLGNCSEMKVKTKMITQEDDRNFIFNSINSNFEHLAGH